MLKELKNVKVDENEINRVVAIIDSMTPHERDNHMIINGSRRRRIAKGSGTSVQEVNQLLKQYAQARKMMKSFSGGMLGKKLGKMKLPPGFPVRRRYAWAMWQNADNDVRQVSEWSIRMLMIRLARFGAKKKPFYRVVVIEKERARNSRNLEVVGHYNPLTQPGGSDAEARPDRALDEEWRAAVGYGEAAGGEESRRRRAGGLKHASL